MRSARAGSIPVTVTGGAGGGLPSGFRGLCGGAMIGAQRKQRRPPRLLRCFTATGGAVIRFFSPSLLEENGVLSAGACRERDESY